MLRNKHCWNMLVLICLIVMLTLISNHGVEGYRQNKVAKEYLSEKRLQHLIRQLQWNTAQELFFETRAEAEGDCTGDILEGYQWNGVESMSVPGVDSTQRCMDLCDANVKCMGWSYKRDVKMCWGLTSIRGVIKVGNVRSGSCVGTNMKVKCTENKSGQYPGKTQKILENIATVEDCMTNCDQLNICVGWLYTKDEQKCYLFSNLGQFQSDNYFLTGSCIATQKRVRVAEPVKFFRKDVLERHNEKRKAHCSPDLTMDSDLNKVAQDFANQLAAADVTPPVYDLSKMQTVYFNKGDEALRGTSIVDGFYDENKYYNYDNPDFSITNHFPKIIWKSSTKLGVGRAFTSDKSSMFVVITYDWDGDISNTYKDNVEKQHKCT